MENRIIKHSVAVGVITLTLIYAVYRVMKSKGISLGRVSKKPPKIEIKFSRTVPPKERTKIGSSHDVVRLLRSIWSNQLEVREEFVVLLLDRANHVIGYHILSKGGITGTVVDSKLLFSLALESLASSIILAHNHPSGNLKPSQQDKAVTRKVKNMAEIMEMNLLDHIILTKDGYYSFADELEL